MMLITTLVVSFCKNGGVSVNVHICINVEPIRSTINNNWHLVGFLFFSYHSDPMIQWSNKHQINKSCLTILYLYIL